MARNAVFLVVVLGGCGGAQSATNTSGLGGEGGVRIEESSIVTVEPVRFRVDNAEILSRSFGMLREVAAVLTANPSIRIRIEGHTDSTGAEGYNVQLSRQRAESIRQFLVEAGVAEARMEIEAQGATSPTAVNTTPAGRAQNRRVEFHILEM